MTQWLKTNRDDLFFEDTSVGRLKKKIWEASEGEIDKILNDYGIPSSSELGKPGTYKPLRFLPHEREEQVLWKALCSKVETSEETVQTSRS